MADTEILFKKILPDKSIADFVACFWMIENSTGAEKEIIVLPDANFDLVLFKEKDNFFQIGHVNSQRLDFILSKATELHFPKTSIFLKQEETSIPLN
jgi:hypothetical protein